ncbi:LysR substrate-binding domain-containing protein [Marinomonas pollencensis]|uniref:LysR family glycine cleavage system transcriptional activator n=1 Tax=Marinomonas pollencensis TaxID=491954 RepID=A0A3E0DRY8_9GAMM|nr:LysR substrate-binding domain-containing protein [Marinomonas pollencensis]REG85891.1 LysR family glycine cleavage system transcriptional activator [Marinomonas pollencensis]
MKRRLPSLNALRAFEVTARLLSFQQAANELNVTHSAVSHQIKKLEQDLAADLFVRMGRRVALTSHGERYYQDVHDALQIIERSTEEIFGEPDHGKLVVQFYMGIASRWLVPRLGHFRQQYPSLNVELFSPYFSWEFEKGASDLGVIYSEEQDRHLSYQYLFKGSLVPVCSPALFDEQGCDSLTKLLTKPLLHVSESPKNLAHWLHQQGVMSMEQLEIKEGYDNYQLALEAAIAGQGVAFVPAFFCSGDIAGGKLVVPLDRTVPEIGCWYVVCSATSRANSRANYFVSWLHKMIDQDAILQQYLQR